MMKKMEELFNYITHPETIVSLIAFIFWLWVAWTTLKGEIKELRVRLEKLEWLDLDSRLTRMQTDIDWIRVTLEKLEKLHS